MLFFHASAPPPEPLLVLPPADAPTHTALTEVTPWGHVQVKVPGVANTDSPRGVAALVVFARASGLPSGDPNPVGMLRNPCNVR